jgi:hypothetical protein
MAEQRHQNADHQRCGDQKLRRQRQPIPALPKPCCQRINQTPAGLTPKPRSSSN